MMDEEDQTEERPSEQRIREAQALRGFDYFLVSVWKDLAMYSDAAKVVGADFEAEAHGADRAGARRGGAGAQRLALDQLGQLVGYVEQVGDHAVVGDLEDRRTRSLFTATISSAPASPRRAPARPRRPATGTASASRARRTCRPGAPWAASPSR